MTIETSTKFEEVAEREDRFQLATYKKLPLAAARGRGAWIETSEGEKYLDLYGGHAVAATECAPPNVMYDTRPQTQANSVSAFVTLEAPGRITSRAGSL